jgi:peptide/nickel transport system permease protein
MLVQLVPGDPVVMMLGTEATQEKIKELRHELGLDKPLTRQYLQWAHNTLQGDFGKSIIHREDVAGLILKRLPITLHLGGMAWCLSFLLGLLAGVVCAVRRGGFLDSAITVFANAGISVPIFWLGILGVYLFSLKLGWLPTLGYTSPLDDVWLNFKQIIMPVACLFVFPLSSIARQTRSSMLEVVCQDYIRYAWAKGLSERLVIMRHALKNALIPVVTLQGVFLCTIVGGSVLVETVFNIPGMGRLLVRSVLDKDFVIVQACVMIIAVVIALGNLAVDLFYGWLDPRIRYD